MKLHAALFVFAAFATCTGAALAAEPVAKKPDLAAGEAKFNAANCASCHNADGNASIATNPKLAGQHAAYLLTQLQAFQLGARKNAVMAPMVKDLSEEDMRNIAAFLASKKMKEGFAKDRDIVALGEQIYKGGIASRAIPACAGCHSPDGAGIPVQYPRLAGQHAEYVSSTLMAFRDGTRKSPQMTQVAAWLNDREIKALADYIAGLR